MAINIYFRGLICHYKSPFRHTARDTKTHSILIRDPAHKPHISINRSQPVEVKDIVFSPNGDARVLTAFNLHVPHIEDLTHEVVDHLMPGTSHNVTLPAGDFTVSDYFPYGAIFSLDGKDVTLDCVARTTILIATEPTLTVTYNGQSQALSGNDCVFIENASMEDPPSAGQHWKLHSVILSTFDPNDLASYRIGGPAKNCKTPTAGNCPGQFDAVSRDRKLFAAATSECTNSQWP